LANVAKLIVLVFVIGWQSAQRFGHPEEPVQGGIVIVSA
jgi:Co/Zn/Cd efflux system component